MSMPGSPGTDFSAVAKLSGLDETSGVEMSLLKPILQRGGQRADALYMRGVTIDELRQSVSLEYPALLHLNIPGGDHYIVADYFTQMEINGITTDVVAVRDPGAGRAYFSPVTELKNSFDGYAITTNPR